MKIPVFIAGMENEGEFMCSSEHGNQAKNYLCQGNIHENGIDSHRQMLYEKSI